MWRRDFMEFNGILCGFYAESWIVIFAISKCGFRFLGTLLVQNIHTRISGFSQALWDILGFAVINFALVRMRTMQVKKKKTLSCFCVASIFCTSSRSQVERLCYSPKDRRRHLQQFDNSLYNINSSFCLVAIFSSCFISWAMLVTNRATPQFFLTSSILTTPYLSICVW